MKTTKEFNVVMLATEKASAGALVRNANGTWWKQLTGNSYFTQEYLKSVPAKSYHLYIISNDEIKDGDWYINSWNPLGIYINKEKDNFTKHHNGCKKIVATTDKSIHIIDEDKDSRDWGLPQIPESFIQDYIKSYNEGKVIENVRLEMGYTIDKSMGHFHQERNYFIKTRPDNTIIVHQNRTCNKSDIKRLIILEREHRFNTGHFIDEEDLDKWIEDNL